MNSPSAAERCSSIVANATWADQAEAKKRFLILMNVVALCHLGQTKSAAVCNAATEASVAISTIWRWLRLVEGQPREPAIWMRWLLPRPDGRKPHPAHKHLHRDSEILSLEEVL
jgi:hypothetical protein